MTVACSPQDGQSAASPLAQLTLARFIAGGHFGAYVRGMRNLATTASAWSNWASTTGAGRQAFGRSVTSTAPAARAAGRRVATDSHLAAPARAERTHRNARHRGGLRSRCVELVGSAPWGIRSSPRHRAGFLVSFAASTTVYVTLGAAVSRVLAKTAARFACELSGRARAFSRGRGGRSSTTWAPLCPQRAPPAHAPASDCLGVSRRSSAGLRSEGMARRLRCDLPRTQRPVDFLAVGVGMVWP